jgi:[ribosomal protein S18]-alanine N-acetyltransferase
VSTHGITLCDGSLTDLDAVMRVMDESFDPRFGEAWTASQCAGLLPLPGVWLTLARDEGTVIGFALARNVADEAELLLLAVRRNKQGLGVGKLLLDRFTEQARERGATRVHLEVREGNQALSLYRRADFTLVGRRRNYYSGHAGQTWDALTLAKSAHG